MGAASLNFHHARAQWPGRRGKRHSNFARRLRIWTKGAPPQNGVLVPLPPWAKEPAAGAAEFPKSSFTPAAVADLAVLGKRSGWTEKTRLVQTAVGVGWIRRGGETPVPTQTQKESHLSMALFFNVIHTIGPCCGKMPGPELCRSETQFRTKFFCLLFFQEK